MKKKNISRRDFLKGSAAGAVSLAAAGLLTACGSSQTPETTAGTTAGETTGAGQEESKAPEQLQEADSIQWDYETDVIVVGAGGAGLPAALKAMEDGSDVILVEANWDVGGHAAISEGNLHFGGGTAIQKRYGIEDTADQYYLDHTVRIPLGTKFNDRDYVRAIADNMVNCYDMCMANGLLELDDAPVKSGVQVFTGTSDNGMGGAVQVQISVEDGKMTAIEVVKQAETEGIGVPAFEPLIKQALEKQSSELDAISGATITSDAFMEALSKAMGKAGL